MKNTLKTLAAATTALGLIASPMAAAPALAQAATPVRGIGIVNLPAIIASSDAFRAAQQQRPVTYKDSIDRANARRAEIEQQLQPLVQKFQADQAANADQQSLAQQAAQIQQIQQAGERELNQILQPVMLSQAYVEEQIQDKLGEAVQAAAQKQGVSLVISPDTVIYADQPYNLNQAVLEELNRLVPSAQLVPPNGWLPRELREQQAQQQAAAQGQAAPAAAATTPQQPAVTGR